MTATLVLGNHLSAAGDSVKVCEELSARLAAADWPVYRASTKSGRLARLADMLRAVVAWRKRYEVAHVDIYSGRAFLWAEICCAALSACNKPYVLTLHGGDLPRFALQRPRRVRRLLNSAAAVTAPSRYLQGALRAVEPRIRVLPNAIDLPRYRFRVRSRPGPKLVWMRAFHEVYDPMSAIAALARLRSEFPSAELTLYGPDRGDGTLQRCRRQAAEQGLSSGVRFGGCAPKAAVPEALAAAEIFLNTSRIDNAPVTLIEAMACGLPIVSSAAGGIPHLITDEQEGLLFPAGDAAAAAAAVRRLLTEPGLAEKLSRNARRKAADFDWERVWPLWRSLLEEIATR